MSKDESLRFSRIHPSTICYRGTVDYNCKSNKLIIIVMKKLLTLCMLLCTVFTGAWADYITPDEGVYQYQNTGNNRGFLAYYSTQSAKPVLAGVTYSGCTGAAYTVATDASGVNLNFGLIRSPKYENVYYVFSVETGKFLSWKLGEDHAKFSVFPTPWKIYERSIGGTTYQLLTTDNFVSASGNGNYALSFACGTTMANGQLRAQDSGLTSSDDGGLKNQLNKQTATSAQEEMMTKARRSIQYYEYEEKTSVAGLSDEETYIIRNIADNRGFLAYNSASNTCVGLADVTYNDSHYGSHAKSYDENTGMLWNIIAKDNGTYELYNKKIQKYVSLNSNNKCVWSDTPTGFTIEYVDGTFRIKANDLYLMLGCGWAANNNPVYLENSTAANSQKLIIGKIEEPIDWDGLAAIVAEANAIPYGDHLGQYSNPQFASELGEAQAMLTMHQNGTHAGKDQVAEAISNLRTAINNLTLNMPKNGTFLRIHGYDDASSKYLQGTVNGNNQLTVGDKDNTALFCYTDGKLVAYTNGQYVANNSSNMATLAEVGGAAAAVEFREDPNNSKKAIYNVCIAGWTQWIDSSKTQSDASTGWRDGSGWRLQIEEAEEIPATFKSAALGYATFNAPVAVIVPEGVKVYFCKMNGETLSMFGVDAETVLPANTPVLLKYVGEMNGQNKTVNFQITTSNVVIEGNDFYGTVAAEIMNNGYSWYSLQRNTNAEKVGFYSKSSGNLGGFKAWLQTDVEPAVRNFSIVFDGEKGEETTAIKQVLGLSNDAQMFDLSGRQVMNAERGLYINNGRKVIR